VIEDLIEQLIQSNRGGAEQGSWIHPDAAGNLYMRLVGHNREYVKALTTAPSSIAEAKRQASPNAEEGFLPWQFRTDGRH
jgi:hypothetical protein